MRLSELLMSSMPLDGIFEYYTLPEMAVGDEREIPKEEWEEAIKLMHDHNAQVDDTVKGFYYIDVTGRYEVYFTLWRYRTDIDPRVAMFVKNPIYMGNMTTNFLSSVKKALNKIPKRVQFQIMTDQNREGLIGKTRAQKQEDIKFTFGEHRGKSLGEVYLEDPQYLLWLHKNQDPKYQGSKFSMALNVFAKMYWEEITKQNTEKFKDVQYVGKEGERYEGEVEVYKIDQKQGQSFSYYGKPQMYTIAKAVDSDGNKFIITNLDKAFPNHKIEKGVKVKIRGKITGNIEIVGIKFNKLGYVKGLDSGNAPPIQTTMNESSIELVQKYKDGVNIDENWVSLEITYKFRTPDGHEESDTNKFSEMVGGREDKTLEQAIEEVIIQAKSWVKSMEDQGFEIGAWDKAGNYY